MKNSTNARLNFFSNKENNNAKTRAIPNIETHKKIMSSKIYDHEASSFIAIPINESRGRRKKEKPNHIFLKLRFSTKCINFLIPKKEGINIKTNDKTSIIPE